MELQRVRDDWATVQQHVRLSLVNSSLYSQTILFIYHQKLEKQAYSKEGYLGAAKIRGIGEVAESNQETG